MQLTPEQQTRLAQAKSVGEKRVTLSFSPQQKAEWEAAVQQELAGRQDDPAPCSMQNDRLFCILCISDLAIRMVAITKPPTPLGQRCEHPSRRARTAVRRQSDAPLAEG